MGEKLAAAARKSGYPVEWVNCPERAETALELNALLKKMLPQSDVLVMAAAVADARPERAAASKIKKDKLRVIRLVKNPDILKNLAKMKKRNQVFAGFALESDELRRQAIRKLEEKSLELIVGQRVTKKISPFGKTRVDFHVYEKDGQTSVLRNASKAKLAGFLIRRTAQLFRSKNSD
jgi:phosphopantothenoylcysteine decarboxylase / phosphopantothenate---cysteine ligase